MGHQVPDPDETINCTDDTGITIVETDDDDN